MALQKPNSGKGKAVPGGGSPGFLGSETAPVSMFKESGEAASVSLLLAPHPLYLLQLAHVLPTEENFLLLFRCQQLKSCEEFMKVRAAARQSPCTWSRRSCLTCGFLLLTDMEKVRH